MDENKPIAEAKEIDIALAIRKKSEASTKESEEIYFWIDRLIGTSDKPAQLDGCEALVNYFEKRKFKKDIPAKKTMRDYTTILRKCINKKRNVLRKRLSNERKANENLGSI